MKKFFIGMTAFVLCLALAGCGDSGEITINSLASQLDETSNIISSMQMVNPSDINLTKDMLETIATTESSAAIYDNVIGAQQTLLNEEYYKTEILSRTSKLKNGLSKNLKLSKAQATAVKELTKNLEKYSNSVAYTQNDMSSTLRQISSLKKNVAKNSDKLNAKLNRLACNSNARSSYYENIILTLNQIENYLSTPQEVQENQNSNTNFSQDTNFLQNDSQTRISPNCDIPSQIQSGYCEYCGHEFCEDENAQSSLNEKIMNENQNANENQGSTKETAANSQNGTNSAKERSVANNPYAKFNSNNINRAAYPYFANGFGAGYGNGVYGANPYSYGSFGAGPYAYGGFGGGAPFYGAYPYGNGTFGGFGNGMYGTFGTPYAGGGINGNNINFARFNPNRNTDTYAPLMRNIDTYRAGTQIAASSQTEQPNVPKDADKELLENKLSLVPEQRLENFEKVNEDNTIEKLDGKQEKKELENELTKDDKIQETALQEKSQNDPAKESNVTKKTDDGTKEAQDKEQAESATKEVQNKEQAESATKEAPSKNNPAKKEAKHPNKQIKNDSENRSKHLDNPTEKDNKSESQPPIKKQAKSDRESDSKRAITPIEKSSKMQTKKSNPVESKMLMRPNKTIENDPPVVAH